MSIALHFKCQSGPRCNLAVRKSDEHSKLRIGLLLQFIRYYYFIRCPWEERKQIMSLVDRFR